MGASVRAAVNRPTSVARSVAILVVFGTLVLVLAGCGGDTEDACTARLVDTSSIAPDRLEYLEDAKWAVRGRLSGRPVDIDPADPDAGYVYAYAYVSPDHGGQIVALVDGEALSGKRRAAAESAVADPAADLHFEIVEYSEKDLARMQADIAAAADAAGVRYVIGPDPLFNHVVVSAERRFDIGDVPDDAVCWEEWTGGFSAEPDVLP